MTDFDNENYMNNQNNETGSRPEQASENIPSQPERAENAYIPQPEAAADTYAPQSAGGERVDPYAAKPEEMPRVGAYEQSGGCGAGNGGYSYNYNRPYDSGPSPYQQPRRVERGYNGGFTNSYVPNYGSPRQDGCNISYSPYAQKKVKTKKPVTRTALVITCCIAVILSGLAGFFGASLATRNAAAGGNGSGGSNSGITGGNMSNGDPLVIYRDVEDVDTSVDKADGEVLSYEDVAAAVKDSVVEITTEYNMQSLWFQYVTEGAGSGVIISEDGYIVTNNHVICDADNGNIADSIKVRLTDGTEYTATVVGADAISDIALLKIEASNLTVAVCGNSDTLAVGEELLIVGNPLGSLGGTVTNGIVSATERTIQVNSVDMTLIQTNAAVNPGNSGGGMFNMMGQLVGIVNAKSSGTGIEGLGFAIPVNEALSVIEQILEYGYVRGRTDIGVQFAEVQNSFFGGYYNLKDGVYVSELEKGYNDNVLKVGDRIIAVDGKEISTAAEIKNIVTSSSVGDVLVFQLYRDGKLLNIDVTCYESVPADIENNVNFDSNSSEYPTGTMIFGHDKGGALIPIN